MPHFIFQVGFIARAFNRSSSYRYLHNATGKFTTISPQGTPTTREIELWVGDPGDSFVMFRPEIGRAFATGIMLQDGCSVAGDPDLYPLIFHHATRHFSHKALPYPKLEIPQDLPGPSKTNSSPATLHTYAATHTITLDGTADEKFQLSMRESIQRLQPVFDQLKDT